MNIISIKLSNIIMYIKIEFFVDVNNDRITIIQHNYVRLSIISKQNFCFFIIFFIF